MPTVPATPIRMIGGPTAGTTEGPFGPELSNQYDSPVSFGLTDEGYEAHPQRSDWNGTVMVGPDERVLWLAASEDTEPAIDPNCFVQYDVYLTDGSGGSQPPRALQLTGVYFV